MITEPEARRLLNNVTNGAADDFMDGQWAAIDTIVNGRGRLLLIQRTGWGKSMVYFLSTRILRDAGAGPTLIVSPLLALMRNQQAAASRLGLSVESINTTNSDDWDKIIARIRMNAVDVVLVSPERLANAAFMETCLAPIIDRIAFFAVDEAHCISDWGHNFRPDYRRIHQVLRRLPEDAAVLATTATANSRVVTDVLAQLGPDTVLQRGPLARDSLQLQTLRLPDRAARLAWLAAALPQLPGSGIVYALTTRDAEGVTAWLRSRRIDAHAYHGQVDEVLTTGRQELEAKLVANQLKVLVATNALGMGFDKPDLGWVIHFQAPQSLIHYLSAGWPSRARYPDGGWRVDGRRGGSQDQPVFHRQCRPTGTRYQPRAGHVGRIRDGADGGRAFAPFEDENRPGGPGAEIVVRAG